MGKTYKDINKAMLKNANKFDPDAIANSELYDKERGYGRKHGKKISEDDY